MNNFNWSNILSLNVNMTHEINGNLFTIKMVKSVKSWELRNSEIRATAKLIKL